MIKRVITSLVGLPIVIAIFVLGNKYVLDVIFAIIAIIAMHEYINCVANKDIKVVKWISYLSVAVISLIHVIPKDYVLQYAYIVIPTIVGLLFMHVILSNMKVTMNDIVYTLLGMAYLPVFIGFLPLVYGMDGRVSGKILIVLLFMASWGTDVFAYSVGMKFGKHKFSKVSPKKSIEGCVGGTVGAILMCVCYAFACNYFFNTEFSLLTVGIISFALSILSQIGDFAASAIKRHFEIKDYSQLFPGHGGMLDRFDSIIFIAPFAYLLFTTVLL